MNFDFNEKIQQTPDSVRARRRKICKLALGVLIIVNPKSNLGFVHGVSDINLANIRSSVNDQVHGPSTSH
ncbi:hypothetical protein Sjap_013166 [Stephania japonica]|uniref:Uncharacterized protein n=1 Tax=Stephania japonica TaxID=461633 RepID=A0AAP0NYX1_9MAGN